MVTSVAEIDKKAGNINVENNIKCRKEKRNVVVIMLKIQ